MSGKLHSTEFSASRFALRQQKRGIVDFDIEHTYSASADAHGVDSNWAINVDTLTVSGRAPEPETEMYSWLVWGWCRQENGSLPPWRSELLDSLPESVLALRQHIWVRRFMELAARDDCGQPLTGEWRTQWLTHQRRLRAQGMLAAGRITLLEHLSAFTWNPADQRWWSAFEALRQFTDRHGRLPTRRDDEQLSNWVTVQRFLLRSDRLRYDRAHALASIKPWVHALSLTRSRGPWERRCEQLRVFVKTHGRYPVSDSDDAAEVALARWVSAQREQLRRDGLSAYRLRMLSSLPFWRWGAREEDWDKRFRELSRDMRYGRFGTDHPQYRWVIAQRRRHRVGRLTPDQVTRMQSLNLLEDRLAVSV